MGEPADAQAVYKTLDPVMLAVLTNPNANISQLLATATTPGQPDPGQQWLSWPRSARRGPRRDAPSPARVTRRGPARRARPGATPSAHGFLIGAVLCFAFFSWYPMCREIVMSFQKTQAGRDQLGGLVELRAHLPRPDLLDGLEEHARVHRARADRRLRGAVLRGHPAQRAPARQGLPALPGLPAGDAAAHLGAAALRLLLRPDLRPVQRHPAAPAPAGFPVGPVVRHRPAQHGDDLGGDRGHLDEHGRRHADLPGRAAEHPGRALRGRRAGRRRAAPQDQAHHDPADPADPVDAAHAADRRHHADVRRGVHPDQRRRRGERQHAVRGQPHLPVRVRAERGQQLQQRVGARRGPHAGAGRLLRRLPVADPRAGGEQR